MNRPAGLGGPALYSLEVSLPWYATFIRFTYADINENAPTSIINNRSSHDQSNQTGCCNRLQGDELAWRHFVAESPAPWNKGQIFLCNISLAALHVHMILYLDRCISNMSIALWCACGCIYYYNNNHNHNLNFNLWIHLNMHPLHGLNVFR